jgi:hypothetical protein
LNHIRTLIAQTPAKLRPGGALVFALDDAQRPSVAELLAGMLPQARISFGPPTVGGDHFVIAQLPQPLHGEEERV